MHLRSLLEVELSERIGSAAFPSSFQFVIHARTYPCCNRGALLPGRARADKEPLSSGGYAVVSRASSCKSLWPSQPENFHDCLVYGAGPIHYPRSRDVLPTWP